MNNFNQIIIVKFEGVWRSVLGCLINPFANDAYIQYILNGKIYECKNAECWRMIGSANLHLHSEAEQYAIDYNNGDLEYSIAIKKAEEKVRRPGVLTVEREILEDIQNLDHRRNDEIPW